MFESIDSSDYFIIILVFPIDYDLHCGNSEIIIYKLN